MILREACQSKYFIGRAAPKSAPEGFEVMQKLENKILKVRRVVKPVVNFGAEPIAMSYTYIDVMRKWLKDKIEAYESSETTHNHGGDFQNYKRPGQEFVQLIKKTRNTVKELENNRLLATERKSRFATLD